MGKLKFLSPEQKEFYDQNGYIKLSGIFTNEEVERMGREYDKVFDRKQKENMPAMETAWQGPDMKRAANNIDYTVKQVANMQMHNSFFTKLLLHDKMLDAVEDILGTENILLHHTKAHLKPPEKGAPYLMHQDYPYFPFRKHTMLAVFVHVDDTTPENGGLCVYPGSQKLGPLQERRTEDEYGDKYFYVDPERFPISKATPLCAKRGEVVIFSYLLLHGSYLNLSDRPRRMFLIQMRAADDEPKEMIHLAHCMDMVLRGENVGMKATKAERFVGSKNNA